MRWLSLCSWIVVLVSVIPMLAAVAAKDPHGLETTAKALKYTSSAAGTDIYTIIGTLVQVMLSLIGFVFFGLMLYSGLRWMIARGQEEFVTKAKDALRNATIGLVIVMAAYGLTRLIFVQLNKTPSSLQSGGQSTQNSNSNSGGSGDFSNPEAVTGCCEIMRNGQVAECKDLVTESACYDGAGSSWIKGSCVNDNKCNSLPQVICYPTGGRMCMGVPQELCGNTGDQCGWDTNLKKCIGSPDTTLCRSATTRESCDLDPACDWVPAFNAP